MNGVRSKQDVILSKGKIVEVTPTRPNKSLRRFASAIDGTEKFLIPGLWDSHIHLTFEEGVDHKVFFPLSIAYGVTSLRDTGGHINKLENARALSRADNKMPSLYVSGPLLDGSLRVYNGAITGFPDISVSITNEDNATSTIDDLASRGVDFIKAYEMLTPSVFKAVIARAQFHGLPVSAHVPLSMSVRDVVSIGITEMQHLRNLEMACTGFHEGLLKERNRLLETNNLAQGSALRSLIHKTQRSHAILNQNPKECGELITLLSEKQIFQTPTLAIMTVLNNRHFAKKSFRKTFDYLPPNVRDRWITETTPFLDYQANEENENYDSWLTSMVARLSAAGAPIIAGTDAPIGYLTPGASLHEELFLLHEAGLSPMEALKSATYTPAKFLGLENEVGTISAGMKADLVILARDPLIDIHNISSIEAVFKNGNHFNRGALEKLLLTP